MSTTAYESPLHVVPELPVIKKKFLRALELQELRRAVYRAYFTALSLPRSVVRWALSQLHRCVEVTGSFGVFSWLGGCARSAVGLIRGAGIVPSVLAVLSTPPVAAAAGRVARVVGRGVLRVASAGWNGLKALLGRCGTTGKRIVEGLSRAGKYVADAVQAVAEQPVMEPIVHALRATLALVRPASQGYVAHRLLGALVPVFWLRAVIGLLFMPILVDSSLVGHVRNFATSPATSEPTSGDEPEGNQTDLLIEAVCIDVPTPSSGSLPDAGTAQVDYAEPAGEGVALNRAERRAQQREDAHARRTQRPRR